MFPRPTPTHLLLTLILGLYVSFGLLHLGAFITADEHYWIYERIPAYWQAIDEGDWRKTLINDKPGVTLALFSGIGLLYEPHPETLCHEDETHVTTCNTRRTAPTLVAFRLPLLIVNGALLLCLFWLVRKLSGTLIAFSTLIATALSPILIGMTQIINPDTLLWSTGTCAIFSFFALLHFRKRRFLVLTATFLALAILSKYTGAFLLFFFFALVFLAPFLTTSLTRDEFYVLIKKNLLSYFSTLVLSFVIAFLLLPSAWIKPSILMTLFRGGEETRIPVLFFILSLLLLFETFFFKNHLLHTIKTTVEKIHLTTLLTRGSAFIVLLLTLTLLSGRILFPDWVVFEKVPFDLKDLYSSDKADPAYLPSIIDVWYLEWNPLIFSLPPIVLFFFILGLVRQLVPPSLVSKNQKPEIVSFLCITLTLFLLFFTATLIFSEVLGTARYLILLYPLIGFLAGSGVAWCHHLLKKYHLFGNTSAPVILFFLLFGSAMSLGLSHPFYFNYTNIFLPRDKVIHHAWGYGGYEAASYLNSLPHASTLTIWSDYYGVCEFFIGRCIELEYQAAATVPVDYVVVSARGQTLYEPLHSRWLKTKNFYAAPAYTTAPPAWELLIGNRPENFIRVVKKDWLHP